MTIPRIVVTLVLLTSMLPGAGEKRLRRHAHLKDVDLDGARWTDGFWADRFARCSQTVIPKIKEALLHPKNSACLANFRVGAGTQKGSHRGTYWGDGDCYKWIEAMARVYSITHDAQLDHEMDYWIDLIARTQASDGYICTQIQLHPKRKRWEARKHHELYNMGHLLTAASVHYQATGKESFLAVARKLADYLFTVFSPRPKKLGLFGWNPSNIMGLVDLYRVTGEGRYLELAGIFVDMRGSAKDPRDPHPGDQNQNGVPLREETDAVGHAVTAAYLYCGAADVCAETGESALRVALERIWRDVVDRKMYVTGAIGAYHNGVSIRGDKVHEAFGRAYELPNRTAYNETCANIGNAMWCRRMLLLTGESRYADTMERVLYNSALSPISIDGERFFYTNPLARSTAAPLLNHDTRERWFVHSCYCCPPSVARTLAKTHTWAYSLTSDSVCLHLYGSGTLATKLPGGGPVRITQRTDYPWSGQVTVIVAEAPAELAAVRLRIPGWAEGAAITIKGERYKAKLKPGTAVELRRTWSSGDIIELELPMKAVLVEAHPKVEACRGRVAIMRGPVVYCLESADLPDGVALANVRLKRDAAWKPRHRADLLGGVTILETTRPLPLRLVPYYAWNNRGPGDMAVWLPID